MRYLELGGQGIVCGCLLFCLQCCRRLCLSCLVLHALPRDCLCLYHSNPAIYMKPEGWLEAGPLLMVISTQYAVRDAAHVTSRDNNCV
ncbi:hypothetical protein V1509DRAFT_614121 [Lipomyces kononenkoae]